MVFKTFKSRSVRHLSLRIYVKPSASYVSIKKNSFSFQA